jgi:hypothetical protein
MFDFSSLQLVVFITLKFSFPVDRVFVFKRNKKKKKNPCYCRSEYLYCSHIGSHIRPKVVDLKKRNLYLEAS